MLTAATGRPVSLACVATYMRKSIDALAALVPLVPLVPLTFHLNPCSPALFVFCNRDRTKLKMLEWDEAGFWLHYRRLERHSMACPRGDRHPADHAAPTPVAGGRSGARPASSPSAAPGSARCLNRESLVADQDCGRPMAKSPA